MRPHESSTRCTLRITALAIGIAVLGAIASARAISTAGSTIPAYTGAEAPFEVASVQTDPPVVAYQRVLQHVGAFLPERDAHDERILAEMELEQPPRAARMGQVQASSTHRRQSAAGPRWLPVSLFPTQTTTACLTAGKRAMHSTRRNLPMDLPTLTETATRISRSTSTPRTQRPTRAGSSVANPGCRSFHLRDGTSVIGTPGVALRSRCHSSSKVASPSLQ